MGFVVSWFSWFHKICGFIGLVVLHGFRGFKGFAVLRVSWFHGFQTLGSLSRLPNYIYSLGLRCFSKVYYQKF